MCLHVCDCFLTDLPTCPSPPWSPGPAQGFSLFILPLLLVGCQDPGMHKDHGASYFNDSSRMRLLCGSQPETRSGPGDAGAQADAQAAWGGSLQGAQAPARAPSVRFLCVSCRGASPIVMNCLFSLSRYPGLCVCPFPPAVFGTGAG